MHLLVALIPILAWYRIRHTRLDRDYTPYAYPAVFGVGYLEDGHHDIKPPLIHWSYKLWSAIVSPFRLTQMESLRLLPSLSLGLSLLLVGQTLSPVAALALALLMSSPTLWAHMANTEWLTVMILSVTCALSQSSVLSPVILYGTNVQECLAWVSIGLLPWANQKNALLLVPVAWALGLSLSPTALLALCGPSIVFLGYLTATRRLRTFWQHCFVVPSRMGKDRTLKQNTLGHLHLLKPGIILMTPFIASMDWTSPWAVVFLACVIVSLWSKQIVPHHFLLWSFPLAMACSPTAMTFVAFGIVWAFRDLAIYLKPEHIYKITFGAPQGDYGMRLEDGEWVADWLNRRGVKEVWVNGMDNNVYLQADIKAWNIVVPEWKEGFEGDPPKFIVHCPGSIEFDYDKYAYEMVESSPRNSYIILERE